MSKDKVKKQKPKYAGSICGDWICPKCGDRIDMGDIGILGCGCGFITGLVDDIVAKEKKGGDLMAKKGGKKPKGKPKEI